MTVTLQQKLLLEQVLYWESQERKEILDYSTMCILYISIGTLLYNSLCGYSHLSNHCKDPHNSCCGYYVCIVTMICIIRNELNKVRGLISH